MQFLRDWIAEIEGLLAEGSPRSLTYAALECRLAIEFVCYERLKGAYGNYAFGDLKGKWQPKHVISELIREVDDSVAASFTVSISQEPISDKPDLTIEEFQSLEYIEIGSQVGFKPKKLGDSWNALSNAALHVQMPKSALDPVGRYGDGEKITKVVVEALDQLREIAQGTLISTGVGVSISFDCPCGAKISRRENSLTEGQVVSCSNPECKESHIARRNEQDWTFELRNLIIACACGEQMLVPPRAIDELRRNHAATKICPACGEQTRVQWQLHRTFIKPSLSTKSTAPSD